MCECVVHREAQMIGVLQPQLPGKALRNVLVLHVPAELQGHPRILQVSKSSVPFIC